MPMSGPIVYISHFRIKEGRDDEWWSSVDQVLPGLEAEKPRTVFQNFYTDEAGATVSIVHIFPDAAAMDAHMAGATSRAQRAYDYLEPIGFEVYGEPTDSYLASITDLPIGDALLRVVPDHRAGFSRFAD
jgi:quinol monooxygenase YgiN